MAAKIMPNAAYLCECLDYEPKTGRLVWRIRPLRHFRTIRGCKAANTSWGGKPFGRLVRMKSGITYIRGRVGEEEFLAHRLIFKMKTGREPSADIDHCDGDGTNNRWNNLREATHQQNQCNVKTRQGTKCPRGVYRIHNNYAAAIRVNGTRHNLGTYKTPEEAHAAYVSAAKRLHRDFSHTERHQRVPEGIAVMSTPSACAHEPAAGTERRARW